ncbi:MFS transporter [Xylanimonas ulmi]|nr:MFS transporter [Xylanibacterium ulmi]
MPSSADTPLFPLRTVVLGAFVPAFLFDVGVGALLPVVAPTATALGSSLAVAGVVAALLPVGTIAADLPAGALAARVGDRVAMILAGVVGAGAFVLAALATSLTQLAVAVLALGAAGAVFNLARHSYLTEVTPPLRRARVLSTMGGVHRIGQFVGPFAGALAIDRVGLAGAYWLGAVVALAAAVTVVVVPDDDGARGATPSPAPERATLGSVLREHRSLFATLGIACLLVGLVRGARQTVIPLWGEHLGLEPAVASVIFGVAGGVDMLLFYPAGKVMDRMGRNWIAIPSMLLMGVALIALPFTGGVASLTAVAMALGFGNGIGSGILMTLGSDASPAHGRAQFLGLWRVLQDTGSAAGPLVVSAGAALGSLAAGIWAVGVLSPTAALALARWVPRWTPHANRTTRRAAGIQV